MRPLWRAGSAPLACRRILGRVRPDVVFGAGGYVSGPMLAAAADRRLPSALLEVDAHMGLANRMAAPLVDRVFLGFPIDGQAAAALPGHGPSAAASAGRTGTASTSTRAARWCWCSAAASARAR